jgi:hypothetical protein
MVMAKNKPRIPPTVMMQTLKGTSILAAQTLRSLQFASAEEEEQSILQEFWKLQEHRESLVDAHAELADALDADIAAITARLAHIKAIHEAELTRLKRWRSHLDQTILQMNDSGLLPESEVEGQTRRILIKLNPPSVDDTCTQLSQVPEEYLTTKTVVALDKKTIIKAWQKGTAIPGVEVRRKRKVVYELAPTTLNAARLKAAQ